MTEMADFPKTVVVHHRSGIGDLIWHIPYFRAIAEKSAGGKITVIAKPSCLARQVLAAESCVEEILEFDYRPRKSEKRKGRHDSLRAQLEFAKELKLKRFQRMVNFSPRSRYNILAQLAGISCRIGFGFSAFERMTLNCPPYISRYQGKGNWVYPEATALAKAHDFVSEAILPRMQVLKQAIEEVQARLPQKRKGVVCFSIGTSEAKKQWGAMNFSLLAVDLLNDGYVVVLLGGRLESALAEEIRQLAAERVPVEPVENLILSTHGTIQTTAAFLSLSDICVGNDTGVLNMALACETPALGLFGASKVPQLNDPLMHRVMENGMEKIHSKRVYRTLIDLLPSSK